MRFQRRRLAAVAVSGLAALAAAGCRSEPPARFEDVVLVTLDTLRADHLGCYHYARDTSPFLDGLADHGVRFTRAVSASSHTAPSHASLLSGLYPEQHRVLVNGHALDARIPTLASLFAGAGRDTAGFVSVRFLSGLRSGFTTWDAAVPDEHAYRSAAGTVDPALAWLDGHDPERRFFLWIHLFDAHEHGPLARVARAPLARMMADSERNGPHLLAFLQQRLAFPGDAVHGNFDRYDAQIATLDAQLRRLYQAVRRTHPGRRVLWVVTADHGEGLGNHGYWGHGQQIYNEQVRVPLVFHGVGAELGPRVVSEVVRHVDLLPTLAELAGVPTNPETLRLEGRSIGPLLDGPAAQLDDTVAFSQRRPPDPRRRGLGWAPGVVIAAQDARYKYIHRADGDDEFYDLFRDPHELNNLAGSGGADEARLREWLSRKFEALEADPRSDAEQAEPDQKQLDDLKALGYL